MARLLIYGDGGCGHDLLAALYMLPKNELPGEMAFVDDGSTATAHDGIPVLRFTDARPGDFFLVAVQNSHTREKLDRRCRGAGLVPWSLIAPTSIIGPQVEIGDGAMIYLRTTITGFCRIGRQFHFNLLSYIGHDCVIGDYVTFGPGVACCGNVHIGDLAYIGAEAVIKNGLPGRPLTIGAGAIVGMGAVVTKDVLPGVTVVGNPARPLPRSDPERMLIADQA